MLNAERIGSNKNVHIHIIIFGEGRTLAKAYAKSNTNIVRNINKKFTNILIIICNFCAPQKNQKHVSHYRPNKKCS